MMGRDRHINSSWWDEGVENHSHSDCEHCLEHIPPLDLDFVLEPDGESSQSPRTPIQPTLSPEFGRSQPQSQSNKMLLTATSPAFVPHTRSSRSSGSKVAGRDFDVDRMQEAHECLSPDEYIDYLDRYGKAVSNDMIPPTRHRNASGIIQFKEEEARNPVNTTVFVGGLSAPAQTSHLSALFKWFGPTRTVKLYSANCGFVTYHYKHSAAKAIDCLQACPLFGQPLRLNWGTTRGSPPKIPTSGFVGPSAAPTNTAPISFAPPSIPTLSLDEAQRFQRVLQLIGSEDQMAKLFQIMQGLDWNYYSVLGVLSEIQRKQRYVSPPYTSVTNDQESPKSTLPTPPSSIDSTFSSSIDSMTSNHLEYMPRLDLRVPSVPRLAHVSPKPLVETSRSNDREQVYVEQQKLWYPPTGYTARVKRGITRP
ncbi:hypothetical protein BCR39DRAFT_256460 [Naematelia encephala]|uniref:RRM domain-containing protein n=1 Tax=Naematelia encephala TaxID=71784 RepID=A0A1Y2AVD6_9TREE|nr:hypothetical protein BCR39DRAFT_256460 [Naematelia encephala]